MTATTYTFHLAETGEILATANPANLSKVAVNVAHNLAAREVGGEYLVYVHNGRGVIAAGWCRGAEWQDTARDDFMGRDVEARDAREAAGWPND